jgi:hypothetical protein
MNVKKVRLWMEAVVAYFKIVSQYSLGQDEVPHEKSQLG